MGCWRLRSARAPIRGLLPGPTTIGAGWRACCWAGFQDGPSTSSSRGICAIFTGYLRAQLEAYDRFAPWLHDRIDQRRLAWLRSKLPPRWSRFWLVAAHGDLYDIR
jgi:hypothetical protein